MSVLSWLILDKKYKNGFGDDGLHVFCRHLPQPDIALAVEAQIAGSACAIDERDADAAFKRLDIHVALLVRVDDVRCARIDPDVLVVFVRHAGRGNEFRASAVLHKDLLNSDRLTDDSDHAWIGDAAFFR